MTSGFEETLHIAYVGEYPIQQGITGQAVAAIQEEGMELRFHSVRSSLGLSQLAVLPGLVVVDNSNITALDQDWGKTRRESGGEIDALPVILFADVRAPVNPQLGGRNTNVIAHVNNRETLESQLLVYLASLRTAERV